MRIAIAHSFYRQFGGEDRYVNEVVPLLRESHDVELIAASNTDLESSVASARRMAFSRRSTRGVATRLRGFRPDVVHLHNAYPSFGPAIHLACGETKTPLVMTLHNFRLRCPNSYQFTQGQLCTRCEHGAYHNAVTHPCFPTKKQSLAYASILWWHRFVMKLERHVTIFVTPSEFLKRRTLDWGIPERSVTVVRNFVAPPDRPRREIGRFGVYVGRLSSEKGLTYLLDALHLLDDPEFAIVGDGSMRPALESHAARLGLTRVRFEGHLDPSAVRNLLAAARYFVMPSVWHENAPLGVIEAMSAGLPLAVSRRGGLPELAEHGGLMFEPGDATDMARTMGVLIDDQSSCERLGAEGARFVRDELSPAAHLRGLEDVYRRAMSGSDG